MSEVNTGTSISEQGIPQLTMRVNAANSVQWPVDATLSVEDEAADAKATGDAINAVAGDVSDLAADVADINARTGADIPIDGEPEADSIADVVTAVSNDVAAIKEWTGEDIPLTDDDESPTIAEAIAGITMDTYPVGSIFMTVSSEAPEFEGTWVEIAVTATWNQLKTGRRGYTALESGETGGDVHFWLRTE